MTAASRTRSGAGAKSHAHWGARRYEPHRRGRRRRLVGLAIAICAGIAIVALLLPTARRLYKELTLPLPAADAALIREQAHEKHLDPSLIAAVVYTESEFTPKTSPTGALGLMQIEPATAAFIARTSGGFRFRTRDLATPSINLAYGSWYLRYLLDRYDGNEPLALAAYNGGYANVDRWLAQASADGHALMVADIPFPETRAYVQRVLDARHQYRAKYARQLGLG